MKSLMILGTRVHSISVEEFIAAIENSLVSKQRAVLAYGNVHTLNLAHTMPRLRAYLNEFADIVICDGQGIRLAGHILGTPVEHRFTPPDHIDEILDICAKHNTSVYLLGAQESVLQDTVAILKTTHPTLSIAGTHHGYFDKQQDSVENQALIKAINESGAGMLIVGFGQPKQEYWIMENWEHLDAHVVMPVGALFDYMSDNVVRAPRFITDNGFEWLARLIIEPKRLWRRYLVGLPVFFTRVLQERYGRQS